ncbi:hypothetical protein [Xylanimonas protaetiae]|uniref:Uncharacterized protein n=1 Tax=Xylanimonas protaetiae TaxID=2509457 RepID=A0A4P6FHC6_9MICO|nr:hypothetical protein [Xylanimonas protaetiae]QAY70028.1 hypothetical protein ET471_08260 [Xylanimonas protaetiae]
MTRYFEYRGGAVVPVPDGSNLAYEYDMGQRRDHTEVKIAPLDAIVISRKDLPPVEYIDGGEQVHANTYVESSENPAQLREYAIALLAMADHVEKHPPVDEEQVKALSTLLWGMSLTADATVLARRLVERGVRVEVTV